MFTPDQRVRRSTLTITPRTDAQNNTRHVSGKGKAVAFIDGPPPPPPPLGLLDEKGVGNAAAEGGDLDDWRRFRDAGLLDEATMERKDRQALLEKAARLEKELFDYQYNMGLLLIENKELSANVDELKEALSAVQEAIKREEAAHFMAVSEMEKREQNLRKALDLEKRCRADLEKALCEIGEENEQIKLSSHTKLADANNLLAGIGDKSQEVDEKMQEADARLADANMKTLEVARKLNELETRESMLQSERLSFLEERKGWEVKSLKQKEDLQEWESKLHQGEERLCESRRIINQREQKVNEIEMALKEKENKFKEENGSIDLSISELKKKEDDINNRLAKLIAQETEAESIQRNLEIKEKELLDLTEKLNAKERVEIQKLLDAHKYALDSKRQEFELEMEEKRKSMEEDMKSKLEAVGKKEAEIDHKEEKLRKREQALEKKAERFKEKEKDLDTKSKTLKEKEKSIKAEAKKLELDQKQMLADKEILQVLKDDIETIKAEVTEKEIKLQEDIEKLRITEDERRMHVHLQSELKEEINKSRLQRETLEKEIEELRKDRIKFEEEWEALDEKKTSITKELVELDEQKETLEKLRKSEEERLEKEKLATKEYIERELEAIKMEKETFAATMEQEQSLLTQKSENEQRQLLHEFELKQRSLEVDLQNRRAEMEKQFRAREKAFEEEREKELNNISHLKEVIRKDMEEMELERHRIDKEKEETSINKKQLEENQLEMHKDINELVLLSKKIRDQREEFTNERNRFLAFVERLKNCGNCGEVTRNYELSDLQMLEGRDDSSLSRTVDDIIERSESIIAASHETHELSPAPSSRGLVSWFKKGVTIFKLSPHRKIESEAVEASPSDVKGKTEGSTVETRGQNTAEKIPEPSFEIASDSHTREVDHIPPLPPSSASQSYKGKKVNEAPEESQQSELRSGRRKPVRKPKSVARKQPTVQISEGSNSKEQHNEKGRKKRTRAQTSVASVSDMEGADSEVRSESVTTGGRRKRRQTVVPEVQTPGGKRYNLRGHKTVEVTPPTQDSVNSKEENAEKVIENPEIVSAPSRGVAGEDSDVVNVITIKRVETHETDVIVRSELPGDAGILEETTEISDDVIGRYEYSGDNREEEEEEEEEDDDGSESSDEHPGEVSIGKKLWTFFST